MSFRTRSSSSLPPTMSTNAHSYSSYPPQRNRSSRYDSGSSSTPPSHVRRHIPIPSSMPAVPMIDEYTSTHPAISKWDDLELSHELLGGIYAYGFEQPSPIQCKAIRPIVEGCDLLAQAQSGTGKTATFTIGALAKLKLDISAPQILILSSTHELIRQITDVVLGIGSKMDGLVLQTVVGKSNIETDIQRLHNNPPHIVLGTPGRVMDLIKRQQLNPSTFTMVIMDEADEMLSEGFGEQVKYITEQVPSTTQYVLVSATMPEEMQRIARIFMHNPVMISVKTDQLTLEGIKQFYVDVGTSRSSSTLSMDKYEVLKDIYTHISVSQCIIYCNSVNRVQELCRYMLDEGFPVACIHGDMMGPEREHAIAQFRSGATRVLISSDLTARGIDVQQVSIVINYDLPRDRHNYLHRVGRAGRWGRKGMAINLISGPRDFEQLRLIETYYACQIEPMPDNFREYI